MPETDLEQLRTERRLRPLEPSEEGFGAGRLPAGVYGFAYAPAEAVVPLFAKKTWHSFEVHKLADGTELLVGFVTAKEAESIRAARRAEVMLYPEPWEDARELVSVPMARMIPTRKGPSREGGNGLKLELV